MLILDSVNPEKWYKVTEVAAILGWAHDTIERWIDDGVLQAFVIDLRSSRRIKVIVANECKDARSSALPKSN